MLADHLHPAGEFRGGRAWALVVIAEMAMVDGGAGFQAVLQAVALLGTAGLSSLRATEPVMAAQMMQGLVRASQRP